MKKEEKKLPRIGGWLILIAIGLNLTICWDVFITVQILRALYELKYSDWARYYFDQFNLNNSLLVEFIIRIAFFTFLSIVIYAFNKRSKSTPTLVVRYLQARLIFSFLFLFSGLFLQYWKYGVIRNFIERFVDSNVIGIVTICIIWIPYFRKSKRVKQTFVCAPIMEDTQPLKVCEICGGKVGIRKIESDQLLCSECLKYFYND